MGLDFETANVGFAKLPYMKKSETEQNLLHPSVVSPYMDDGAGCTRQCLIYYGTVDQLCNSTLLDRSIKAYLSKEKLQSWGVYAISNIKPLTSPEKEFVDSQVKDGVLEVPTDGIERIDNSTLVKIRVEIMARN